MSLADICRGRLSVTSSAAARRLLALGLVTLVGSLLTLPAAGQEAAPAAAQTIATQGDLTLEVRKGRVIRLPRPAATVFVADPEIADVQAQSPSIVYLFGRKAGETSLYAVDEDDQLLLRTQVIVQHNLSGLRRAVEQLLPSSRVTVSTVDGSIVLDGTVESPVQAQELRELAGRYIGDQETLLYRVNVSAPTQVHLRVRVAEVSRDVLKEFGITGKRSSRPATSLSAWSAVGRSPMLAASCADRPRQPTRPAPTAFSAASTTAISRSTRRSTRWPRRA